MAEIIFHRHLQKILNHQKKNKNNLLFSTLFWRNNYFFNYLDDLDKNSTSINTISLMIRKIEIFLKILKIFTIYFIRFSFFKLFVKKSSLSKNLEIFKVFFNPNFSGNNKEKNKNYFLIKKRYKANNKIFFLPVMNNFSTFNILSSIKNINRESEKFLILEHYISFFELTIILFNFFLKTKIKIIFKNKDISKFYEFHLHDPKQIESCFLAILYFKFINNLNLTKFEFENLHLIWENHPIDKALIKASKLYFPKVNIFGYLIVFPPFNYHSIIPTSLEFKEKLLPNYIYTNGSFINKNLKKYTKRIKVKTNSLFSKKKKIYKQLTKSNKILILLPIYIDECIYILNLIKKVVIRNKKIENKIVIKFHPSVDSSKLLKENKRFKTLLKFISKKNTDNLINTSDKIIMGISSLYYDLICNNLDLIIITKKFKSIKEIFGIKNSKTLLIKDENNLCKVLNLKTKKMKKKFNSNLFNMIYS